MKARIELPDQKYALAKLHENGLSVSFEVFEEHDDSGAHWDGFVKWDGCSNWMSGSDDRPVMAHFCDEDDERATAEMFVTLRKKALEMMGDKADFTVGESRLERALKLLDKLADPHDPGGTWNDREAARLLLAEVKADALV